MREMINGMGLFYVVGCQLRKDFTFMELLPKASASWNQHLSVGVCC